MDANVRRLEILMSLEAHFGHTPVFFNTTPFAYRAAISATSYERIL